MNLQTINFKLPQDILIALNEIKDELINNIRTIMAIHYYQKEKLTIGKAAQMACISRYEFETLLSKNKIPISNLDINDVRSDIKKLREMDEEK